MRKLFLSLVGAFLIFPTYIKAELVTDPALLAAVGIQTAALEYEYNQRKKTQDNLIITEGAVAGAMAAVHDVEKTTLEYMSNASSAMDNLYQLKRAAELIKIIPENAYKMVAAVPQNYKGTAVTAFTEKTLTDVLTEMTSLYNFMAQLVTTTKYSFKDEKGEESEGNGKKNVNLLSAAERYYIASEVVSKLERINNKILAVTWQVQNLGWEDAWRNLDPDSFNSFNQGKAISENLINKWKSANTF